MVVQDQRGMTARDGFRFDAETRASVVRGSRVDGATAKTPARQLILADAFRTAEQLPLFRHDG